MKITKISAQKRSDRYNLFVDDKFVCGLTSKELLDFRLAKGDEVSQSQIEKIKIAGAVSKLKGWALNYLASRPHSVKEVERYLQIKAKRNKEVFPPQSIKLVTEELEGKNYLDDNAFAIWFIKQRVNSSKPRGPQLIRSELMNKGVGSEIIDANLSDLVAPSEIDNALKLGEKKFRVLSKAKQKTSQKQKQQFQNYLASRGYSWNIIRTVVDRFFT